MDEPFSIWLPLPIYKKPTYCGDFFPLGGENVLDVRPRLSDIGRGRCSRCQLHFVRENLVAGEGVEKCFDFFATNDWSLADMLKCAG
jgi:hypothetical protein